jgi:hypothetical protein
MPPWVNEGGIQVLGSYAYAESRSAVGVQNSFHDISPDNLVVESAYSVWQNSTVVVSGVPDNHATHAFRVELYSAPDLQAIQLYVDNPQVRNLEADYVVRCPLMCLVRLNATAYYPTGTVLDIQRITELIYQYVNSRSFVPRLSRSELAKIMMANGVSRLDMQNGLQLQGLVRKADGTTLVLQGDALDLTAQQDPRNLFTQNTCVFACEQNSIFIQGISE